MALPVDVATRDIIFLYLHGATCQRDGLYALATAQPFETHYLWVSLTGTVGLSLSSLCPDRHSLVLAMHDPAYCAVSALPLLGRRVSFLAWGTTCMAYRAPKCLHTLSVWACAAEEEPAAAEASASLATLPMCCAHSGALGNLGAVWTPLGVAERPRGWRLLLCQRGLVLAKQGLFVAGFWTLVREGPACVPSYSVRL